MSIARKACKSGAFVLRKAMTMLPSGIQLTSVHRCARPFLRTGYLTKLMPGVIVSLFLVHPVLSSAQSPASARKFVRQGRLLMSRNKIDEAIKSFTRAVEENPNYAEAYVDRGIARRTKGDLEGSIEDYEKAASIDPNSVQGNRFIAEAYSNRGYIRLNALEVDNAIQNFTTAIRIKPDDPDHYYRRGLARLINEDLGPALEDLNKSLSIAPSYYSKVLIYATRGVVKLLQDKTEEAQKDFEESIKLNQDKNFMVESYIESLQFQIMLMRQRRAKQQKTIV
jgi:tetratricopeptide (TPR) repeat protein